MDSTFFNLFNFNAYRTSNLLKIQQFQDFFDPYDPTFVFIQEINVVSALKVFSNKYQVFINVESNSFDRIGIVSLVKKGLTISDSIISENGRVIGLKVMDLQVWNVYPQSGSGFKKDRETFLEKLYVTL